ncbi:hypothetical protein AAHZ94_25660 [Streptomyces sp. HSW2009]|uniref:hypothetical protein n=1 Tax=Streptomyces sp. HSW2009 TaxID=3142890 RepID=UPI0032EAEE2C
MASASEPASPRPNTAFRRLRGQLSPGEFAALVRRSAREIGEQVSCDARYIGRVESGAIRCPNYAYERVFRHMFPGRTLSDLGFAPRASVRGNGVREAAPGSGHVAAQPTAQGWPGAPTGRPGAGPPAAHPAARNGAPAPDGLSGPPTAHPSGAPSGTPAAPTAPATPPLAPAASAPHAPEGPYPADGPYPATAPYSADAPHSPDAPHFPDVLHSPDVPYFPGRPDAPHSPPPARPRTAASGAATGRPAVDQPPSHEEGPVRRRAFMTLGSATVAAVSLELGPAWAAGPGAPGGIPSGAPPRGAARAARVPRSPLTAELPHLPRPRGRIGTTEAAALEEAVRHIRLLDDRHGGDGIYRGAVQPLNAAYDLLDAGTGVQALSRRLHSGAGELAISVGWLAHDSGRVTQARSHYAEALATARLADDQALESHAFCNMAFLARDAQRPREAVQAAQAGQRAARGLASPRLLSLLALREAGGRAGLADRAGCVRALLRAQRLFDAGPSDADPEWMTFFGEAELAGLEAQCWSALREWQRAAEHAERAVLLQGPQFVRNTALFTAELALDLVGGRAPDEAAAAGERVLALLGQVHSTRIRAMLDEAADGLRPWRKQPAVARFLTRHAAARHG